MIRTLKNWPTDQTCTTLSINRFVCCCFFFLFKVYMYQIKSYYTQVVTRTSELVQRAVVRRVLTLQQSTIFALCAQFHL